ncbi:hypothetical protein ACIO3O_21590 [Streptomyces sp. NPDC087440]|uniref:hypothetical protein n=1 Tax=Streptomyces sp. NPDC087440 TaxID=3365790 RepID=UPI00382AEBD5
MTPATHYDESAATHPPQTAFAWTYRTDGQERYEATGPCPVCGCTFTARWPWGQSVTGKGGFDRRREAPDTAQPWAHFCVCRAPHLGRPAGITSGCGAWVTIAVPTAGLPR